MYKDTVILIVDNGIKITNFKGFSKIFYDLQKGVAK